MNINWFPGHMTKALRQMEDEVKNIDVVLYVLDSRAPLSCLNPKFSELVKNKQILYVFNKIDLADTNRINDIQNMFNNSNMPFVSLDSRATGSSSKIEKKIRELSSARINKLEAKGVKPILKAMVIGVPNSGKSTLVNSLCKEAKAITGNRPGVTKGKQWLKMSNYVELLDTPGTLWPSFDERNVALNLAFIGSIKDDVLDINELSVELVKTLLKQYPGSLEDRFKIKLSDKTPIEIIESIAESRKYLLKGGDIDYDRTCLMIIDDFRKGRLGKITLDRV